MSLDLAPADAFYCLYHNEFAFVWATARRYGVPVASLDDAVQDVFLTAYRRREQIHFEVSARAWLHGVTRRVAARYRRSASRLARRLAAVAAVPSGPTSTPQERLAAAEELDRLLRGLGRTRAVFEMAEILGMSGPEIASELGIPVSTVYSRVRLARAQLARELGAADLGVALEDARERVRPPQEAAQRGWAVLLPCLGSTGTGAGAGLGALASVREAMTLVIVLAGAAAVIAWPRLRPEEPAQATPQAGAAALETDRSFALSPRAPPSVEDPAPVPAPALTRPGGPSRADDDRLTAEVALVDRARAALDRGAVDDARALLTEHARRFPDGALADLRGATEVELLCRLGLAVGAKARAAELAAAFPRSVVAQRFADFSCRQ